MCLCVSVSVSLYITLLNYGFIQMFLIGFLPTANWRLKGLCKKKKRGKKNNFQSYITRRFTDRKEKKEKKYKALHPDIYTTHIVGLNCLAFMHYVHQPKPSGTRARTSPMLRKYQSAFLTRAEDPVLLLSLVQFILM